MAHGGRSQSDSESSPSRRGRVARLDVCDVIVALDFTLGVANRYGARVTLVRFRGDSSVLPDVLPRTFRVLDSRGQVARTVPFANVQLDLSAPAYTDDTGRLLYSSLVDSGVGARAGDSTSIVRVDLESRRVDTVGRTKNRSGYGVAMKPTGRDDMDSTISKLLVSRRAFFTRAYGSVYAYAMQGLVPIHDDWAVLSDGSIALVRGHIGQLCDAEFRRGNPRSRRQRVDSADGSGAAAAWSARLRRGQHVRPTVRPRASTGGPIGRRVW
jgi:hypothetical protein